MNRLEEFGIRLRWFSTDRETLETHCTFFIEMLAELIVPPKKPVLSDHKRQGKRLVPPFVAQIPQLAEVAWVQRLLPELIWIGILTERLGGAQGSAAALGLATAATKVRPDRMFAFVTPFSELTREQQLQVVEGVEEIRRLRCGLAPFLALYPDSPLAFVGTDGFEIGRDAAVKEFGELLFKMYDRRCRDAMLIQASSVYLAAATGKLHVMRGTSLGNLKEIERYPETEESRKVASSIRASVNGYGLILDQIGDAWPRYFWNQGIVIGKCVVGTSDE